MKSRWIWIGAGGIALCAIVYVLVTMLFGNISDHLYVSINAEAQVQLSHICDLEHDYHKAHGTYSTDLETLGFYQSKDDGSKFVYEVGLADSNRFIARAFARMDYDQDEVQLTWEVKPDCTPVQLQAD